MFGHSCMFGCTHLFGYSPVCLGTSMFGCPHMCGCPHVCLEDVWMPAAHIQHKESVLLLCQTEGVSICPHTFGYPICLDVLHTFGCHHTFGSIQTYSGAAKHMESIQTYRGLCKHRCILTYGGSTNMGAVQTYRWASKHRGVQTYGAIQTYGGI